MHDLNFSAFQAEFSAVDESKVKVGAASLLCIDAIDVLETNPLIGRPSGNGKRELIIGPRRTGYVALYWYFEELDLVIVLAIRSQREAGYAC